MNDHIRVISSTHPVEIESGGIHQVKPWFTGRLDFAPRVDVLGRRRLPADRAAASGYFVDRKAAVFVFKRRLHTITLLVFPRRRAGAGRPATRARVGRLAVSEANVARFLGPAVARRGLGYALVSDLNAHDLETLAAKLNDD